AQLGDQLLQQNLPELLASGINPITKTLTELIMQNRLTAAPEIFAGWVVATNQPGPVRAQALELLAQRRSALLRPLLTRVLAGAATEVRLAALRIAATDSPTELLDFLEQKTA